MRVLRLFCGVKRASLVLGVAVLLLAAGAMGVREQKHRTARAACAANMRSVGQLLEAYAAEFRGGLPGHLTMLRRFMSSRSSSNWDCFQPADGTLQPRFLVVYDCPGGGLDREVIQRHGDPAVVADYRYLGAGVSRKQLRPSAVLLHEPLSNHQDGAHFLMADGSVQWKSVNEARELIARLESGWNDYVEGFIPPPTHEQKNALGLRMLRGGACVVLMRHTETDAGTGDPPGFDLERRSTQRNLTPLGEQHARDIGKQLKAHGVRVDHVYSSPWYRCRDTADRAFGRYTAQAKLGANADQKAATAFISAQLNERNKSTGGITVCVTHNSLIRALTGHDPLPGELVILNRDVAGKISVAATVLEHSKPLE